jgi:hypothetical protein
MTIQKKRIQRIMMKLSISASLFVASLSIVSSTQAGEMLLPVNQEHGHLSLDLNQAFTRVPDHSEIRVLSQQEMKETQRCFRASNCCSG